MNGIHGAGAYGIEEETLDLVLFGAAGWRFGVEAKAVGGAGSLSPSPLPAVETLLGLSDSGLQGITDRQCLSVKGAGDVSVQRPVVLCSLPVGAFHLLPPLVAARCRLPGLRALALLPGGMVMVIDLRVLLAEGLPSG